jgi:protein SPT2
MVTGKPKSAYAMRDIDSDDDDMEADAFALETEERVRSGSIFCSPLRLTLMGSSSSRIALKEDMLALEEDRRHEEEKRQRKKEKQRH